MAVIAKEWSYLWPIRSHCEELGVPVQMADEDTLNYSRLREVQSLLRWLDLDDSQLTDASKIAGWLERTPESPWNDLVSQAVEDYGLETAGNELSKKQFKEWLAEWGREARRSQTGLLLVSAHKAKGLEFDTVVLLDGGWAKISRSEDQDASRRLFYVAMTRARKMLLMAEMNDGNQFVGCIPNATSVKRPMFDASVYPETLDHIYRRPPLKDIHIGYPGYFAEINSIHNLIKRLKTNDEINLEHRSAGVFLTNMDAQIIGKMAGSYRIPDGFELISAHVYAVISHSHALTPVEYQINVRCKHWEVVVPELVYRKKLDEEWDQR